MRRRSIAPTYDSRDSGPRFHVTTTVRGRVVDWRAPLDDPFVRVVVHVGLWDLLAGLLAATFRRSRLGVTVIIGADSDLMNDVLELDANTLIPNSTRWTEYREFQADAMRFQLGNPDHAPEEGQQS